MQIWKKLGLTVVLCVLSAGMTVNAGFTGSNVHSAGQSMGVGGLLEESMDPEACLEAAQNAKETRKKIYGYENLGVAKVNDYLNIRKDPSENGELVGKLPKNGGADVLSEENGWYKIKSGKVTGYVRADYMVTGEEARNLADKEATNMAVCNSGGLRVREEGSLDAPVITLVAEGEELEVVDIQDDWVKIMLDDEAAYVSADYVDIAKKLEKAVSLTELKYGQGVSDIRVDLVNYAKQFLGNPYVWGGTSLTKGAGLLGLCPEHYEEIWCEPAASFRKPGTVRQEGQPFGSTAGRSGILCEKWQNQPRRNLYRRRTGYPRQQPQNGH